MDRNQAKVHSKEKCYTKLPKIIALLTPIFQG
jgi:hypothetical protein